MAGWTRRPRGVVLSALLLSGCASTSAAPAFKDVAATVQERSGHRVRWEEDTKEDKEVAAAIDRMLAQELTADGAVQVALLGNPSLRSRFEELSVAQAELVQACLLRNPVFGIGTTAWEQEHIDPNLFFTLEQEFLDLLMMPVRKRIAAAELEATKLEVGDRVLALAAEVRAAFYETQAAEQIVSMRRLVNDAAQAAAELARRQHEAGTMNDLALHTELGLAAQTRVDLTRAIGEAAIAREHLTRLMGAWGGRTRWRVGAKLPELPKEEVDLEHLEARAVGQRLDVGAARRELQALDTALSLARTTRWTGLVSVNLEAGRLRDTKRVSFGYGGTIEIPLFDQRQAGIARMESARRTLENNLQALAIDVRSEVRASSARVVTARRLVEEYGQVLVPLRENIVKFSQEQYDAMLLGVYQLLLAKQNEFTAYGEYIEALRDYWIARSELERAVGGRLSLARPVKE